MGDDYGSDRRVEEDPGTPEPDHVACELIHTVIRGRGGFSPTALARGNCRATPVFRR